MKKTVVIVSVLVLCGAIIVFLLIQRNTRQPLPTVAAKGKANAQQTASAPKLPSAAVPVEALPTYRATSGYPYERAVAQLRALHPEFGLTDDQTAALQSIFSKHYKAFVDTRNKAVRSRELPGGGFEIQVPAIPELGSLAIADYMDEVHSRMNTSDGPFTRELDKLFRGFTENAGLNSVTYTLTQIPGSSTHFSYVRDVVMANPETGKPSGSGRTSGITDITTDDPVLVTAINAHKNNTP